MTAIKESLFRHKYMIFLGILLVTASFISLVLERVHTHMVGYNNYRFLVWNLFLAWIPFGAAAVAYLSSRKRLTFFLIMPICILVWLAFFPNAPYLLTDFQHLAFTDQRSPLWFDVIIMIWFAWTGLLLGITSLYLMQDIITRVFNALAGWIFVFGATALSAVGVYMGRFLRWNSWDILQEPIMIARDVYGIMRHPISNRDSYIFTILFTMLFLFIYLAVHLFGSMVQERSTLAKK